MKFTNWRLETAPTHWQLNNQMQCFMSPMKNEKPEKEFLVPSTYGNFVLVLHEVVFLASYVLQLDIRNQRN